MSKDKLFNLLAYQTELNSKLSSPTPAKHVNNPETYKAFLKNELCITTNKIEKLKNK